MTPNEHQLRTTKTRALEFLAFYERREDALESGTPEEAEEASRALAGCLERLWEALRPPQSTPLTPPPDSVSTPHSTTWARPPAEALRDAMERLQGTSWPGPKPDKDAAAVIERTQRARCPSIHSHAAWCPSCLPPEFRASPEVDNS